MGGAALASLEGVGKRFGDVTALQGLTLDIRAGEVFGLLGPNGAGKTTALRILCGLLAPDTGRAAIAGHDVMREPLAARRAFAYVPDGAPLYSSLTPLEHLRVVGELHGMERESIDAESQRLLAGFDLADRAHDPVGGFSRGMRQKAAIACALLPRPQLLILDEPLTGLDADSTLVIKALLRKWADRGGAVLYTSHLLDVVERVCDRMAVLSKGSLLALGGMDELRTQAGEGQSLEEVFRTLTHAEDPDRKAARILGS